MKKLFAILLLILPVSVFGQNMSVPTHYDAGHTAEHIMKGHVKMYLKDSTKWVVEKKNERYVTTCGMDPNSIKNKLSKIFAKGKPEFTSRTNGGYIFTIAVISNADETKVINYVTFHIDAFTQKIEEIEVLLGE